jgi:hypothetical protein
MKCIVVSRHGLVFGMCEWVGPESAPGRCAHPIQWTARTSAMRARDRLARRADPASDTRYRIETASTALSILDGGTLFGTSSHKGVRFTFEWRGALHWRVERNPSAFKMVSLLGGRSMSRNAMLRIAAAGLVFCW